MYLAPFEHRNKRAQTYIFPAQLSGAEPFLDHLYKNINTLSDRPVLLVWGMQDFAFQESERRRFETLFPDHTTVLLENAGHFIQEDAPKDISNAISDWFKRKK